MLLFGHSAGCRRTLGSSADFTALLTGWHGGNREAEGSGRPPSITQTLLPGRRQGHLEEVQRGVTA